MIMEIFLRDYPVGTLTKLPGDHFFFSFYQDYIDDENRPILSQSYIQSDKTLRFKGRVYRGKLPTRLVLGVVRETAEKTKDLWSSKKNHCLLSKGMIKSIDDHMERFSF